MTRTSSALHPTARTLTMSLSTPGSTPAGAGIVGAVLGAFSARRARRPRG